MLEYNVIQLSFECLVREFVVATSLFLTFLLNNVVLFYYSLDA